MGKKRFDYQELENLIYKQFRDNLSEEFDITRAQPNSGRKWPDITISKRDKRLAVVEIIAGKFNSNKQQEKETWLTDLAYDERFRYAIIAKDENTFFIKDCFRSKDDRFKKFSLHVICDIFDIIRNPEHVVDEEYREAFFGKIDELFKGDNSKVEYFKRKNRSTPFSIDDEFFFFENESVEDELFECFLQKFEGEQVCRYTSLSSLFRTINNGEQSMCCIVGMNDRSECTYADDYLRKQGVATLHSNKTKYEVEEENKYFILSCMDRKKYDDLTMWRLYGDNTKGVNILYDVDQTKLGEFKLYHINYAEKSGDHGHRALNKIAELFGLTCKGGQRFKLRKWNEWKHFFKPYEYRDELEIRLLYSRLGNTTVNWILTSDYQIACPLATFKLQNFPLVMDEILLGPNCPDIEVNQLQLELMIKEKSSGMRLTRKNNIVSPSMIGTYRM